MKKKKRQAGTDLWDIHSFNLHKCFPPNDRVAIGILCLLQVSNDIECVRECVKRLGRKPHDKARGFRYEAQFGFLVRLLLGLVRNALVDLLDGENKKPWACRLLNENEFLAIVGELKGTAKSSFAAIQVVMSERPKPFWSTLNRIRHNGVFHYSWKAFNQAVTQAGPTYQAAILEAEPINERQFLVADMIAGRIVLEKSNLRGPVADRIVDDLFSLMNQLEAAIQGIYFGFIIRRKLRRWIVREKR